MKSEHTSNWEKLYETSSKLSSPAHAKQLLSNKIIIAFHELIKSVLVSFFKKGEVHMGLKTYINNELRNDIVDSMLERPPLENESLEDWSKIIFKDAKFGVIINYLENYSNDFSEKAATLIQPLLKEAGMPLGGLSFLFFMGNYGYTPFGVHKEAVGEEGFLFHLGPNSKKFYTWDDPRYNKIEHNTLIFHEFDEILLDAKCHELGPGDAMFIPNSVYHIANTEKFSLSFVMDYINPPKDSFEHQLLLESEAKETNTEYLEPLSLETPISKWKLMIDDESILQKAASSLEKKILSLKSNAGILRKSQINKNTFIPNGDFSIKGKTIFPILLEKKDKNKIYLYARGHCFNQKTHPHLASLIDQLNTGKRFENSELIELLQPGWELVDVYGLISDLLKVDAITAIPS